VLEASRGIWAQAADVASDAGLRPICERAGLDWGDCMAALEDPDLRARVDADTAALADLGHWGVPVFVFEGELFWGQDRIEDLEAALREAGLERSPTAAQAT
jgi:2-hydroxychromene-2-carboxylate isomerase